MKVMITKIHNSKRDPGTIDIVEWPIYQNYACIQTFMLHTLNTDFSNYEGAIEVYVQRCLKLQKMSMKEGFYIPINGLQFLNPKMDPDFVIAYQHVLHKTVHSAAHTEVSLTARINALVKKIQADIDINATVFFFTTYFEVVYICNNFLNGRVCVLFDIEEYIHNCLSSLFFCWIIKYFMNDMIFTMLVYRKILSELECTDIVMHTFVNKVFHKAISFGEILEIWYM